MPESLLNINGYNLRSLNRVNILLGKNGCGKSTLLRSIEGSLSNNHKATYNTAYITPERGGVLIENSGEEQGIINDKDRLSNTRRQNQLSLFKQQTVYHYRLLKEMVQDEIELVPAIRQNASITFDTYLGKINTLLDNIKIIRDKAKRTFSIQRKGDSANVNPNEISSGESELISLGIECLTFVKRIDTTKGNILFLDEPDVHLHPDLQSRLVKYIRDLIQENFHFQIIIATHSTAILGAFAEDPSVNIAFMKSGEVDVLFQPITKHYKRILPVFGAHPLSEVFSTRPILLVEGEDDVRIWQQAIRTSAGNMRLYPVSTESIDELNAYEVEVQRIITSVYDTAKAYSLRDRDDEPEGIDDLDKVIRFRLSCRNAENLILSNEVLQILGTDWTTFQQRTNEWINDVANQARPDHATFVAFRNNGFLRKTFDFKEIRNVLVYLSRSRKPWEVAVGQAIGNLTWNDDTDFTIEGSLINFLGEKVVKRIVPKFS